MGINKGSPLSNISIPPAQYATLLVIEWGLLRWSGPALKKTSGPQQPLASSVFSKILLPPVRHALHRCSVSESQNPRMAGIGRDLWRSPCPTPLLEQAPPEQGHRAASRQGVNVPGKGLHTLPGQPVPLLWHPHRRDLFSHIEVELPVFQLVPVAPCPVIGHYRKESGPILKIHNMT